MSKRRGKSVLALLALALVLTAGMAKAEDLTANALRIIKADNKTPAEVAGLERMYNSFASDLYPDMMGASINAQRRFSASLPSIYSYKQTAHYQDMSDAGGSSDGALANIAVQNYYVVCPTTMCSPGSNWVMWDVPFFTKETHKRDDGYMGYEQNTSGFATGISRLIGESSAIGLAVGYDRRKLKGRDDYIMENKGDTMHVALYGGTNIGHFFLDGYAGFSRTWNKTKRRIEIPGNMGGNAYTDSKLHDNVYSAGLKASYVWILGNDTRITPSLGVDFSHVRMGGTTEKGNHSGTNWKGNALKIDKSNFTSVAMPLMVSINKTFSSCFLNFGGHNSLWTPEVRGGFVPQFGAKRASAEITALAPMLRGVSATLQSTRFNRSYGTVGAGLKIKLKDKFIFAIDYDYSFASKWNHHSLSGMYGVSF